MKGDDFWRRLRGALGNALVWGGAWFGLGFVLTAVLRLVGVAPPGVSLTDMLSLAVRAGVIGFVVGGAAAPVIRLLYHGRRVSEISWIRFGIGGGLLAGAFVPLFLQFMNLVSGDGLVPWNLVLDDAWIGLVLGGLAAGGTIKLAQSATALSAGEDEVGLLEGPDNEG